MGLRFLAIAAFAPLLIGADSAPGKLVLEGTWTMVSAYEIHADGTRTANYGEHPSGLMMVDQSGHYSIQIFRPGRPSFKSGIKSLGTPDEYRDAVAGSSTHFGRVQVNSAKRQLLFDVAAASFPNWEGKRQIRDYSYMDGILRYAVPAGASADGSIAYSVWQKAKD